MSKAEILGTILTIDDPSLLQEIIRTARERAQRVSKQAFSPGDRVAFAKGKSGERVEGTLKSVNRTTATIVDCKSGRKTYPRGFRVPFSMLEAAA